MVDDQAWRVADHGQIPCGDQQQAAGICPGHVLPTAAVGDLGETPECALVRLAMMPNQGEQVTPLRTRAAPQLDQSDWRNRLAGTV